MQFHLKQQDSPLFAAIHKPEEQPDKLFRSLGFEQTWKEWSDSQKAEDRQEKTLQQPGGGRCRSRQQSRLGAGAHSQPGMVTAGE